MKKKKIIKYTLLFSGIVFLLFVSFSCQSPNEPINSLTLSVDFSCTEAWLNISTSNVSLPQQLEVTRDGKSVFNVTLITSETTLYDSTLTPNKSYTYHAILSSNQDQIPSNKVTVTTLDTTSHNFTWQTFTLGDAGAGNSVLYDVAIINENDIWAVGEIYMKDSTGQPDPHPYNLAKWDGKNWTFQRIYFSYKILDPGSIGDTIGITAARSIFAFNDKDIWLAAGTVQHWNGTQWQQFRGEGAGFSNKIWGSSSSDMFFVGGNGTIIHYFNGTWQKIESGTDVRLLDVWGYNNNVWISGYEDFKPTVLLKYSNNALTTVINDQNHLLNNYPGIISGAIESIWTNKNNRLFLLTWYGLYRMENDNFNSPKNIWSGDPNTWALIKVRGNDVNDIVASGINGRIWHYNGLRWNLYNELANNADTYYSLAVKGNTCIAVGYRYINGVVRYGLVQIGHR